MVTAKSELSEEQAPFLKSSDVDHDPVGSAFNWVRGSGRIQGYKLREKQSLTNTFLSVFL